mmetsp:Transcript_7852/g.20934  ORF Transcript_7852/g.20934 Transcript_7852/m.20934 type:complete len:219 (-) Transcript_7852:446-1102(-)
MANNSSSSSSSSNNNRRNKFSSTSITTTITKSSPTDPFRWGPCSCTPASNLHTVLQSIVTTVIAVAEVVAVVVVRPPSASACPSLPSALAPCLGNLGAKQPHLHPHHHLLLLLNLQQHPWPYQVPRKEVQLVPLPAMIQTKMRMHPAALLLRLTRPEAIPTQPSLARPLPSLITSTPANGAPPPLTLLLLMPSLSQALNTPSSSNTSLSTQMHKAYLP